jgi:DNA-binding transcriptional LysR family regulator
MFNIMIKNAISMEFIQLRSFALIARERSVTRAAVRLGLTQPALSLQIKALEAELGEALFARQRRQMRLTPAGEVLYRHVQTVLATLEEARAEVASLRQLLRGHLALATSDTNSAYVLPVVLQQFRALYPQVRLDIRNRMSSQVLHLVLEHEVEFGIATLPLVHRQVTTELLFHREEVVICPPDHPLSQASVLSLAQVSPYPLLVLSPGSTSRRLLDTAFAQAGVAMQVAMNLGSIDVLKRFVAIGLGVAIVPRVVVAEEAQHGHLVAVPIQDLPARQIGLVERKDTRRSLAATAFLHLLREYLPQGGGEGEGEHHPNEDLDLA